MPLLKIGKTYINTDNVVEYLWDGDRVTVYYNTNDETGDAFTTTIKDEEAFALLRWLDATAIDIMTPEPAPVTEASAVAASPRKFQDGDTVEVTRKVIEDDWIWVGRVGRIINNDGDNGYQVDFGDESAAMLEEQLRLYDDSVPF